MNYAKSGRLYYQSSQKLLEKFPYVYENFMNGEHTVRRKSAPWSGLWTDLSIEQILMKSLKGSGEVIGRGMSENVTKVWTKTVHKSAAITSSVDGMTSSKSTGLHHEDMVHGRILRDNNDYVKFLEFFYLHNPFVMSECLQSLTSGVYDERNVVNCDQSEEVGRRIQTSLDNKTFGNAKMKRNDKVVTLQSLSAAVHLDEERIDVNPLTLFLRLVTIVDRQPEKDVSECFQYELSSCPMSLFKNNRMRVATKANLKNELLKNVDQAKNDGDMRHEHRILDGGALLWLCDWRKGEKFLDIFDRYIQKCKELHASLVVFDGYDVENSTKVQTQERRGRKVSSSVEIHDSNKCASDRKEFFRNYGNKSSFITALSKKLENVGIKVNIARGDADTIIVKAALLLNDEAKEQDITVLSDDTDVLCLLVHHCSDKENKEFENIHLMDMRKGQKAERSRFRVVDVANANHELTSRYILFTHSFTGCDTTSAIFNYGKTKILEKSKLSAEVRFEADKFYRKDVDPETIGNSSIRLFELLFANSSKKALALDKLRRQKYDEMVSTSKLDINPSILPPTQRAAYYHGLRVRHQMMVWMQLSDVDLDPLKWRWTTKNGVFEPVKTDLSPAPQFILKVIRCACKGGCATNRCSCKRNALKCAPSCTECNGLACKNSEKVDDESTIEDPL